MVAQFKSLQFQSTPAGQAEKVVALERESTQGWVVVSETITPGKFRGGKACCFFTVFPPCAFLAGHNADTITVTLRREADAIPLAHSEPPSPRTTSPNASLSVSKEVSLALGIGIFLAPYIFSWFLLRDGYTKTSRYIAFGWLAFVMFALLLRR